MAQLRCKAYAKINIGLDVLRRLENGYHEVRMIMQTISLHDTITLKPCAPKGIILRTDRQELSVPEENLAYKAAKLMFEQYNLTGGLDIELKKNIPIAAGLAGGSTDAAAVLRGINQLYDLCLTTDQLCEQGVKLGADVPYCICGGTYLSEGIGEILTPEAPMPSCYVLVAKPPIQVSTKWVYENLHVDSLKRHPDIDGMLSALREQNLKMLTDKMENVLESVTIQKYPVIHEIKSLMEEYGAVKAMMSGSGPTVFGIFQTEEDMRKAYERLAVQTNGTRMIEQAFGTTLINAPYELQ